MTELFINWQNEQTRRWHVVGKVWRESGLYHFGYTLGAERASGFFGFGRMTNLHDVYVSPDLFPFLANRILSRSRPEYGDYLKWMNIDPDDDSDTLILSRSGGARGTDSLQVFAPPEPDGTGAFHIHFFVHALRHIHDDVARFTSSPSYSRRRLGGGGGCSVSL